MDESQLLKGILEACVLKIISKQETYGYQIMVLLNEAGFDHIIEGTLYPILTRLEKKQYITCRRAKSPLGPIRKYYQITPQGIGALNEYLMIYQDVITKTNELLLK